jgi:hypothetical protein
MTETEAREGAQVVPLRSIEDVKLLIYKKFDQVVAAQQKFFSVRVECGELLLELRKRIEGGELGKIEWWAWYGENFTRSRRDAERVMELASQEDPEAAERSYKANNAAAHRQAYDQQPRVKINGDNRATEKILAAESVKRPPLALVETLPEPEIQHDLIDRAIAVVKLMNIHTRHRFIVKLRQVYRD